MESRIINGVTCIKGEIHSMMTLLRLNTRWSQSGRAQQQQQQQQEMLLQDENPFVQSFRRLNEYLEGLFDIRDVDCVMYISPFHQVIISEQASGPLTSAALSSLSKFALYGFLNAEFPRVREGIGLIASCISRCVFEETDWESDEVILMKLLELSALSLRCDASRLLTVGAAWDMYSTCISIHSQYRASKILRSEAENALRDVTLTAFSRAHYAFVSIKNNININKFSNSNSNSNNSNDRNNSNSLISLTTNSSSTNVKDLEIENITSQDIRNQSWDTISQQMEFAGPIGITLLLGKIMTVLSGLMDLQKQTVQEVKFSLSLVNIALEAGGQALGSMGLLVDVLRGDICRHLLRASQSDDLAVFSLSLRVVFNLFMSIKDHMKVQLEVFLTSVHLRLLTQTIALSPAREELALESLLEFCREPSLMHDLYTNYDCDVQCTNLFDSIISTLCTRAVPIGQQIVNTSTNNDDHRTSTLSSNNLQEMGGTVVRANILNRLALDGVFAVLHAVAVRCAVHQETEANEEEVIKNQKHDQSVINLNDLKISSKSTSDDNHLKVDKLDDSVLSTTSSCYSSKVTTPTKNPNEMDEGRESSASVSTPEPQGTLYLGNCIMDTPPHELLEMQVDRWCSSEPGSPQANDSPTPETADMIENQIPITQIKFINEDNNIKSNIRNTIINNNTTSSNSNSDVSFLSLRRSNSSPYSSSDTVDITQTPSLNEDDDTIFPLLARAKTAEVLRQRKLKKQRLRLAAEKFNKAPLKSDWLQFSLELGLVQYVSKVSPNTSNNNVSPSSSSDNNNNNNNNNSTTNISSTSAAAAALNTIKGQVSNTDESIPVVDSKSVARFLKNTPSLGKTQVGEYLSKGPVELYPFHAQVLKEYVDTFDFSGKNSSFDRALRLFLGHFRLPGEAQCIDRLMESFAGKLFEHLGPGKPFASADAAFILAFSTIMLNTDLHNPNLPQNKRMTKEEFLKNNRKINDGEDLPKEYLEKIYSEIKARQIQVDMDINGIDSVASVDFTDMATWNKLIRKSAADQAPAAFTPTVAARKGAGGKGKAGYLIPLSIHDKDMFLVMAKPVLETIVTVWEMTDDDQMVRRTFEGIWDHASVCVGLNLQSMLSNLIEILAKRTKLVLINARRPYKVSPTSKGSNKLSMMEVHLRRLERDGKSHDLMSLLSADFSSLISSQRSAAGISTVGRINWVGAHIVRGELMIKTIFHILQRFSQYLDGNAWLAVAQLLLWLRRKGTLPPPLAKLGDITIGEHGCRLPLSSGARECVCRTRWGNDSKFINANASGNRSSWWSWWSQPNEDDDTSSTIRESEFHLCAFERYIDENGGDEIDGNACIYNMGDVILFGDAETKIDEDFLRIAISSCKVDEVFFHDSQEWDESQLNTLLTAFVDYLSTIVLPVINSSENNSVASSNTTENNDLSDELGSSLVENGESIEFDAVVLLEWICNIIFSNKQKACATWPKFHTFFRNILEDRIDTFSLALPYFLERSIVTVIRATSSLAEIVGKSSNAKNIDSIGQHQHQHPLLLKSVLSPSSAHSGLQSVWLSLRLLRGLPNEILSKISDRVGAGVLSLVKYSPGIEYITTLEQWYILFSLLSAATCGPSGRPFVWDAICHLIDNNLLNDMNFTPCRHLVLRFMHGVFPGETETGINMQSYAYENVNTTSRSIAASSRQLKQSKENQQQFNASVGAGNPWLLESMVHLMRLTTMAMSGYGKGGQTSAVLINSNIANSNSLSNALNSVTNSSTLHEVNTNKITPPLVTTPGRVPKSTNSSIAAVSNSEQFDLQSLHQSNDSSQALPRPHHKISTSASLASSISTSHQTSVPMNESNSLNKSSQATSIRFSRPEEVELLWLESCKAFADLSNSMPLNVSKKATFCIQSIFMSGNLAGLPDDLWFKALQELVNRLPISLHAASHRLIMAVESEIIECCLRCCNIVFEMIVTRIKQLRGVKDFQNCWLLFTSSLASNANMVTNGLPIHEEMLEMIAALLRLLRPPSLPLLANAANNHLSSSTIHSPLPTSSSSSSLGFFRFLAPTFFGDSNNNSNDVINKNSNSNPDSNSIVQPSAFSPSSLNQDSLSPSFSLSNISGGNSNISNEGGVTESAESDATLLCLCWKNICNIYPSLPATLRLRNPQLVSDLTRHVEAAEVRSIEKQHSATALMAEKTTPIGNTSPIGNKSDDTTPVFPQSMNSTSSHINSDAGIIDINVKSPHQSNNKLPLSNVSRKIDSRTFLV